MIGNVLTASEAPAGYEPDAIRAGPDAGRARAKHARDERNAVRVLWPQTGRLAAGAHIDCRAE
jgi:hypothetical protein